MKIHSTIAIFAPSGTHLKAALRSADRLCRTRAGSPRGRHDAEAQRPGHAGNLVRADAGSTPRTLVTLARALRVSDEPSTTTTRGVS